MEHMSRYLIPKNISSPIILNMKFKYNQENIIFNFPQEDLIQFQSFLWCSPLVFSNIPFEDFRFLLYALMLEKHIAFVSINLTLLTSTVYSFFLIFILIHLFKSTNVLIILF